MTGTAYGFYYVTLPVTGWVDGRRGPFATVAQYPQWVAGVGTLNEEE